jgi:signal peptidase I
MVLRDPLLAARPGFVRPFGLYRYCVSLPACASRGHQHENHERIFINKFIYRFEPIKRGDVVVFWYPLDTSKSYIKRVIGLPGEWVTIQDGRVLVNGKSLAEPYVPPGYLDRQSYPPVRVEPGHYFVLGDHRGSSNDSRVWGTVEQRYIYGKAAFVYWPLSQMGFVN